MNKKAYMTPAVSWIEVETVEMIANSLTINTESSQTIEDTNDLLMRDDDTLWDEEE